ncbi:2-amino-4-hydroxy-6-hydroxymethyldihydropteridine diphosphokinase [Reichenbachiella sp. MALMAid0571]|uniref:2-amino-4-hydroxy-6- hydroxymethyldihydropteridine diphosphokinase n=1 Tax=Reichenbachiella sp. MALMAid0571 TaxID=3143939 RepID=UPI0032DE5D83
MAEKEKNTCYILLGTNQGNKIENLAIARSNIEEVLGIVKQSSAIYETEPWGRSDQDTFLNQVLEVDTINDPDQTLFICLEIEKTMGRVRIEKWMERIIDIDILYFNDAIISTDGLMIPHPEIQNRRFTLVPLVEIAPDYIHPIMKKSNKDLLDKCPDPLNVKRFVSVG